MNLIYFLAILGLLAMNVAAVALPATSPGASSNHSCTHVACFDPINHGLNHGITNRTRKPGKANLLLTNEEGWADKQLRVFYESLRDFGHNVFVSAPPYRRSSTKDQASSPSNLDFRGCHYRSCPKQDAKTGFNQTDPRLNWVNAEPATCVGYGLKNIWPKFQKNGTNEDIDMVLVGPAVGANRALEHRYSGTTGAANYAARKLQIPSIAFAGWNSKRRAWNQESVFSQELYAELAKNLTNRILANGKPYLPPNTILNVNFPRVDEKTCTHLNFKYVLTGPLLTGPWSKKDLPICKTNRLPSECVVVSRKTKDACFVSISPMDAKTKGTVKLKEQLAVLKALEGTLSCYPKQSGWKEFWKEAGCALRFWEWK